MVDRDGRPELEPLTSTPETDPETPYMIIYTSGTTGRPKGAVHVHGGFPIKGAQDLAHCFDLGPGDRLFWFTDLGWMMGPWAISGALLLGAELVLYEGAPDYPAPDRLWQLVARHEVTHLGLSPTVIRALMAHGTDPLHEHDLSSLRVLGSTGEPWNPGVLVVVLPRGRRRTAAARQLQRRDRGERRHRQLQPADADQADIVRWAVVGAAADVIDADGNAVRGAVGELALRQPLPGMTRGFWQDPDRYLETYWSRVPGTWVHGDWAMVDEDGYWFIQGRSDDTLKVAGKRVGPAEVESAAVAHKAVLEAAAVGVPHDVKGEVIVVFVRLRPGEVGRSGPAPIGERQGRRAARQGAAAGGRPRRERLAADALRQAHAPRRARRLSGRRPGRPVGAREPARGRGDPYSGFDRFEIIQRPRGLGVVSEERAMPDFTQVHWLAVIIATVAGVVLGFIWYLPQVFGRRWAEEGGIQLPSSRDVSPLIYLVSVVQALIQAYVVGLFARWCRHRERRGDRLRSLARDRRCDVQQRSVRASQRHLLGDQRGLFAGQPARHGSDHRVLPADHVSRLPACKPDASQTVHVPNSFICTLAG